MIKLFSSLFVVVLILGACTSKNDVLYTSKNYKNEEFKNQYIDYGFSFDNFIDIALSYMKDETKNKIPSTEIPIIKLKKEDILNLKDNSVIRFSHSTLLIKLDNRLILSDPMFGERASPFSFMGPKRFHKNPIEVEDLPFIDIVMISHNHYDHLDEYSLEQLKDKVGHFYVPLGLKEKLISLGINKNKISQMDWWQIKKDKTITLVSTPAQHFSGRGLFDTNKTLWTSWVIKSSKTKLFFSGDSGYFKGFKEIGDKYGPFDMSFMENGAYNKLWKDIHMMPKESIQAHLDLKAKILFPIHNGTFELALHSWSEPLEEILKIASKQNVKVVHPKMGESISILEYKETNKWWSK